MRRKKLTDFLPPLYSDDRTGRIVIDEPPKTTCTGCGDEHSEVMDRKHCYCCQRGGVREHWWNVDAIAHAKPPGDETPDPATAEPDKLSRDETPEPLPEMRGGEVLLNPRSGKTYRVHKVANKGQHATAHDEPLYRLENVVIGNRRWTLDELAAAGMRLEK